MTQPDWDDLILVGRIARTHGLRGEVAIEVVSDFADDRFKPGKTLWRRDAQGVVSLAIASVRPHHDRALVCFDGVDTIEAAEALGRAELRVAATDSVALPAGTYHHYDLVGCEVVTDGGTMVGRVSGVGGKRTASCLIVQGAAREVLVPLVESICVEIDLTGKRIVIAPPDGLLDLN
jgi:16S rRNA processing protein RimM